MTNITASIVLYNNALDQVRECIESLQADARVHVLLVDNSEKKAATPAWRANTSKFSMRLAMSGSAADITSS